MGPAAEVTSHLYARVLCRASKHVRTWQLALLEQSGYPDRMPQEIYYRGDVSKPPKAGDKFIQLDWEKTELRLTISQGIFIHARKKHHRLSTVKKFSTPKELQQAVGEAIDNTLRQVLSDLPFPARRRKAENPRKTRMPRASELAPSALSWPTMSR